jgi:hypothetical protein
MMLPNGYPPEIVSRVDEPQITHLRCRCGVGFHIGWGRRLSEAERETAVADLFSKHTCRAPPRERCRAPPRERMS